MTLWRPYRERLVHAHSLHQASVTSPWPGRRSSTRRAWRPSAEATARSDVITARSLAESSLDAYRAYACFPCSLPCSPTPLACPRVCVVFGYRTLCTLRSSVRSTVPWRHVGPKPAASRSSEPVTSCASPGSDLSQTGGPAGGAGAPCLPPPAHQEAQDEQACGCRRVRGGGCSSTLQTWCVTRL